MKFIFISICFSIISFSAIAQIKKEEKSLKFIAMGDFGRNGEYFQKETADQMGKTAKDKKSDFFIITGDNFYPNGVASTQDYSWIASFEQIYTAHSLQYPWYVVLGNHDYKGNVQAEIDYSKISNRWKMPARYYSKLMSIGGDTSQQVLFIFLDTTPFTSDFYTRDYFVDEIKNVDTTAQKKWLDSLLFQSTLHPNIKWKIAVGHHPLITGSPFAINKKMTTEIYNAFYPVFNKYKVDAYICGHEHNLQYIKPTNSSIHYFITGSGSETLSTAVHPNGGKFALAENGFMSFNLTEKNLFVEIIDKAGKLLYSDMINK